MGRHVLYAQGGMPVSRRRILKTAAVVGVVGAVLGPGAVAEAEGDDDRDKAHVRWDIISLTGGVAPGPINPGGHADARAPDNTFIRLTGSGRFVAPASGNGDSRRVTGGGMWETFSGTPSPTTSTGSGTYRVTELVSWEMANFQASTPVFIDNIDEGQRANGTAVLKIAFSDGTRGVLTVGCHGPGSPPGIFEGVATTKRFKTYYDVQPPQAGIDANRTNFHVRE